MKFGLLFELSVPRPWSAASEQEVFNNSLEQARLADQLGFDQIWVVEHHFLEEYSHASAPDLFLTACAMVTERVRLGHGIVVCLPEFNHPVRLAERLATLDILSGGRLEVGTGRSSTWTELGGFGVDPNDTKKRWDEVVRALPKMWTQERFSWNGQAFSVPERCILPKPLQRPHPPLWVAVTSPGTEIDAAERGLGSLGLSLGGLGDQEQRITNYRRRIQSCEPVGATVNEQVATVNFLYCHEDQTIGASTGERLAETFTTAAAQVLEIRESYPTATYRAPGLLSAIRQEIKGDDARRQRAESSTYGSPDHIIRALRRWEALGVDAMVFMVNCLETIPQNEVLDSLRLFASEVMPAFRQDAGSDAVLAEVMA